MGATPNLALPWPELPSQADGPAAFQALATATENKMSGLVSSTSYFGDLSTQVVPGSQATVFSQDIAVVATGWAWIDIQASIAVNGPQGGAAPGLVIAASGGSLFIQQNTTVLRTLRWHSRNRVEMPAVSGGVALALPPATTLIQLRLVMSTDSTSGTGGGWFYEYNVGVTQFGAAR